MKKVLFLLLALLSITLVIALPVLAQEKNRNVNLPESETVDHDYFAGGDQVHISGTVNGDAYVGGGTVIVDGKINGDLLTGGGNVTVSGNVQGDVRTGGGNVTISGANIGGNITVGGGNIIIDKSTIIQGSIVAGGGNIQVFAPVGRGITIGGGSVLIANSVGGDILAGVGELTLSPGANVAGDLAYWSENKANIAEGATVSGTVKQEIPRDKDQKQFSDVSKKVSGATAGFFLTLKIVDIIWLIIVGLALIFFFPNYTVRASDFVRTKFGWALLTGLIAIIVLPIAGVILFITLFGIPIAFILFFVFFLMLWIGRVLAIYALGRFALERTGNKNPKALVYIVGIVIYLILTIIPIVNFITDILVVLSGTGSLLAMKREYYSELRKKKLL